MLLASHTCGLDMKVRDYETVSVEQCVDGLCATLAAGEVGRHGPVLWIAHGLGGIVVSEVRC